MRPHLAIAIAAFTLATACYTTPPKPSWLPAVGERVATNYCQSCPNDIGPARIVVVTAVKPVGSEWRVFAKEFPKSGLTLDWVAKW